MIDIERLCEDYEISPSSSQYKPWEIREVTRSDDSHVWLNLYNPREDYSYSSIAFVRKTGIMAGSERAENPQRIRKKASSQPVDRFQIRAGRADWGKDDWVLICTLDTLDEARSTLERHQYKVRETTSPFRFMMKKVTEEADVYDFDAWAEHRFASGHWTPLPWASEPWVKPELAHHHAHISIENDTYVAYWSTPSVAQKDEVGTISAGRYLNQFYNDVLTPEDIARWVNKMDPPGDLVISGYEPEDIYEAYAPSAKVSSCMAHRDERGDYNGNPWASGKNPVRVYGAGDLAVATLIRHEQVVGRALVWPEKKVAGRRYGDIGRMELALRDAGYQLDCNSGSGELLCGARLLKIEVGHNWMMPYLDFEYRVRMEDDFFFLTKDGGYPTCFNTNGLLDYEATEDDDWQCARCGEYDDEDSRQYIYDREEYWCYGCYVHHSSRCGYCEEAVANTTHIVDVDEHYCGPCTNRRTEEFDNCYDRVRSTTDVYDANSEQLHGSWCEDCVESRSTQLGDRLVADETLCAACDDPHPSRQECEIEHECA